MKKPSLKFKAFRSVLTASLLCSLTASLAFAQTPAAPPTQQPAASGTGVDATPSAPVAPVDPLPRANPKFFTAASPTVETVNAFLHQVWGYDPNRVYRTMAIVPTAAPGVIKVVVYVTQKSPGANIQAATFFVTPDGKHAIAEGSLVVPFGATPFAAARDLLRSRADGASRGAASTDLEIVEFSDFQCPKCNEAQSTMNQIVKDFPNAHVVFQLFPMVAVHPSAFKAAAYGICAQKQSNDAFFKYADGVFDTQGGLSPSTEETLLKAAVKRAGLDSDAIAACASTPATRDIINADIKLAEDAGVDQAPTIAVNGRVLPLAGNITYEQLKQLIQYQATLDGVDSGASAETLAPRPPQPTLKTLPR